MLNETEAKTVHPFEVRGLVKERPDFQLGPLDWHLPQGQIMGLAGPNGSGKTTLLRSLIGMIPPSAGQVLSFGVGIGPNTPLPQQVGLVLDKPALSSTIRVAQLPKLGAVLYPSFDEGMFVQVMSDLDMPISKKPLHKLSRGMQVKAQLALALASGAATLILDEPTSGLDPSSRSTILDLLQDYCAADDRRSVLFSTHIVSDLEHVADQVTILLGGQIKDLGTPDELRRRYLVVRGSNEQLQTSGGQVLQRHCYGLKTSALGFEALVETPKLGIFSDAANTEDVVQALHIDGLPPLVIESASLDEIVAYLGKKSAVASKFTSIQAQPETCKEGN
ncbi:MAG: ABC transporter ATP-binding protein [Actinomycetaceae bacterium]|nr:ABC transporter ATP-binding protein [Actinomycetaceae bacterium]